MIAESDEKRQIALRQLRPPFSDGGEPVEDVAAFVAIAFADGENLRPSRPPPEECGIFQRERPVVRAAERIIADSVKGEQVRQPQSQTGSRWAFGSRWMIFRSFM